MIYAYIRNIPAKVGLQDGTCVACRSIVYGPTESNNRAIPMRPPVRAKDVMRSDVVTARADMDVWELARLLTAHGITGAPVVDGSNRLIGVVSQTDIVRHLEQFCCSPSVEF